MCTVRLGKLEKNRTRFVVGGDRINYQLPRKSRHSNCGNIGGKLLFNSVVSRKYAKFMTMDISIF